MGKKPKTPPIETDEVLITVWNPYPAHIRIDEDTKAIHLEDCATFAQWINRMVDDSGDIITFYWKPKNKSAILVELSRYRKYERKLLGAHNWDQIFKKVAPEEVGRESRIHKCRFENYHEAEKLGWKKVDVQSEWFENPHVDKIYNKSYPAPKYCDLPNVIDMDSLCCPIPLRLYPKIEAERKAVATIDNAATAALTTPGAASWHEARTNGRAIPSVRIRPVAEKIPSARTRSAQKPQVYPRRTGGEISARAMMAIMGAPLPLEYSEPPGRTAGGWADQVESADGVDEPDYSIPPVFSDAPPLVFSDAPTMPSSRAMSTISADETLSTPSDDEFADAVHDLVEVEIIPDKPWPEDLPDVQVPDVEVPDIEVPVEMPDVEMPSANDAEPKFGEPENFWTSEPSWDSAGGPTWDVIDDPPPQPTVLDSRKQSQRGGSGAWQSPGARNSFSYAGAANTGQSVGVGSSGSTNPTPNRGRGGWRGGARGRGRGGF